MLSAAWSLTTGNGHESHENTKVTKKNSLWARGAFSKRLAGNRLARLKAPREDGFRFVSFVLSCSSWFATLAGD
jgi:hypothetical protein